MATMIDFKAPRIIKRGTLTITVRWTLDEDADTSYLTQEYESESPEDRAKYKEQDAVRLAAYHRDEWSYLCCAVEIQIKTAQNWAVPTTVGRAYLFGIESDSGDGYMRSVENEQISEAFGDLALTRKALNDLPTR